MEHLSTFHSVRNIHMTSHVQFEQLLLTELKKTDFRHVWILPPIKHLLTSQ